MIERLFSINWEKLLLPETSVLEIFLRGSIIFLLLFACLRLLKRQISGLSISDLLLVVVITSASSNAMTGGSSSLTDGIILIATIMFWNFVFNWLDYHLPGFHHAFRPRAMQLIDNGQIVWHNLRKEFITEDELMSQVRLQGINDLAEVRAAYIEADGRISVICHETKANGAPEERSL